MKRVIAAMIAATCLSACGQLDTGDTGLWRHYGQIESEPQGPGFYWYNPWSYDLITVDTRATPYDGTASVYTRDQQTADVTYRVTFQLPVSNVVGVYSDWGPDWANRIIPAAVDRAIKDEFGLWTASDAVARRPILQDRILRRLRAIVGPRGLQIAAFDMRNIDYDDAFEAAARAAQVATQQAVAARNRVAIAQAEAETSNVQAAARAEAIRVEAAAIASSPQLIELRRVEAQRAAVDKWNGQLPANMYGSAPLPFLNVEAH